MKTQYYTATSLDGFIATEDDSLDWLFPLGDINDTGYPEFVAGVGALAMGSATYEWMLRHAGQVTAETGSPWPYAQPAWIFTSRELPAVEGADIRFVRGDVRAVHAEMKAAAGSSMPALWMSSSSRSLRSPWGGASRFSRGASPIPRCVWFRPGRSGRALPNCAMRSLWEVAHPNSAHDPSG